MDFNIVHLAFFHLAADSPVPIRREMTDSSVIEFGNPYRVRTECEKQCKIKLTNNGKIMEEVNEFKYLGLILCKHESMEGGV